MNYNFYFDIAALCIAIVVIVEYQVRSTIVSRQTKAFSNILSFATSAILLDLASTFALEYYNQLPTWFNHLLLALYNLFFHALSAMYLRYVMVTAKSDEEKFTKSELAMIFGPYIFDALMVFSNPFTNILYRIDENGVYSTGFGVYISYGIGLLYMLFALHFIFVNRNRLNRKARVIVIVYSIIILTSMIIQALFPNLLVMCFGIMISLLLMAFTLESPAFYEEQQLGIYNRLAFQIICSSNIAHGKQFAIVGMKIDGLSELREMVGVNNVGITLKDFSAYMLSIAERKNFFSISESQFALIVEGGESEIEMMIKKIQKRFDEPFIVNHEHVHLGVAITRFSFPKDAQTTEMVMDLLEYSLLKTADLGKDVVVVANATILEERQRMNTILSILKKALAEGRFSIYYQPIYSVEFQRFTSAEALLRLYDDELGFISPDEFVPIAEKNGLMVQIGEYVVRDVCRFIAANKLKEKGIERIDVNLSKMQCLQEDLHEKIISIMDDFKVDYSCLCLEIAETASAVSNKYFRENMERLVEKGVKFSLDDYGTGYANLSTVVEYPFTVIKLDRSMLWSAVKNEKAMTVLRQNIRMMKQLSMELIAEGVENDEQAQLLAYYGCDYFQGYYYAKPQNGESFLKLLETNLPSEE